MHFLERLRKGSILFRNIYNISMESIFKLTLLVVDLFLLLVFLRVFFIVFKHWLEIPFKV